ncbi:MAG TPA: hypothetical protein DDY37_03215 [Legionella sp.]|nr:hypothetical protein [Legionella sp.]
MKTCIKHALSLSLFLPLTCPAFSLQHGSVPVELGMFTASAGKGQDINLQGFVGNQYTAKHSDSWNGMFGVGYFVDGFTKDRAQVSYGIDGFYLGKTSVHGTISQEHFATNLSYKYNIQNIPVYLATKATIKTNSEKYNLVFDAGIGPNFMRTSHYAESPLNNFSMTNPFFSAQNNVAFSAMAGLGVRINKAFGNAPLVCGYRFFYLGQGDFKANNSALLNTLKTGNTFANAVTCGVVI